LYRKKIGTTLFLDPDPHAEFGSGFRRSSKSLNEGGKAAKRQIMMN
jgi:hypothetical protein